MPKQPNLLQILCQNFKSFQYHNVHWRALTTPESHHYDRVHLPGQSVCQSTKERLILTERDKSRKGTAFRQNNTRKAKLQTTATKKPTPNKISWKSMTSCWIVKAEVRETIDLSHIPAKRLASLSALRKENTIKTLSSYSFPLRAVWLGVTNRQ